MSRDIGILKINVDALASSIHKSQDIQSKLKTKIQWGSTTRPWRGLMDRYSSLLNNYEDLKNIIKDNCVRYYQRIVLEDLEKVSNFLSQFTTYFDVLEAVKTPSIHHVILFNIYPSF